MQGKYNSLTEGRAETLVPSLILSGDMSHKDILISLPLHEFEKQIYAIIVLEKTLQWLFKWACLVITQELDKQK